MATPVMGDLAKNVEDLVDSLVEVFPLNAYPGNVFKNGTRMAELLSEAGL